MLEWLALIGNGGLSILSLNNDRLPIVLKKLDWVKALFLGQLRTSNEAFEAYQAGRGKELTELDLQEITAQMEPACII